ncbi:MAG: hypothetical protein ACR2N3_13130 [Pyrinomonadaceae bacterium]
MKNFKDNFYLQYALLLAAAFLFVGKPVPYSNESSYLLRLIKVYHPQFLLNDLTFSAPANEHWLFDHLFGLLTFVFSIEFIGWIGRIGCWAILLFALVRLGRHWKIPLWMITVSIFLWLCGGQSIVADEWIIGVFEAKCVAYVCLLFALDGFCNEREIYPAILLGLSFSFHPAVGLWAIPAVILALAFCRRDFVRIIKITIIAGIFSLAGLVPLLSSVIADNPSSADDWKFAVLVGYPFHFDPFSWAKSSIILVFLLLAFCLVFYHRNKPERAEKFLLAFLSVLCVFFSAGIILRAFGQYELLRFMPARLFPVFAPLFFLFTLAKAYRQKVFVPPVTLLMLIGFVCLLGWESPISRGFMQIQQTANYWRSGRDGAAESFVWLKNNTPNGTIVISPPWRNDFWYLSGRAQIVSYIYAPISNLREWRERLNLLIGNAPAEKGLRDVKEMKIFYNNLPAEKIIEISAEYKARYIVTEGEYDFPLVFKSGTYKIYRLPAPSDLVL